MAWRYNSVHTGAQFHICGKPSITIGEIAIVAALKSELPLATLWSTERRR